MAFFRTRLARIGAIPARAHLDPALPQGARVTVAGLVLIRQRPGTAKGVVFLTLEDETGIANVIVWRDVFEAKTVARLAEVVSDAAETPVLAELPGGGVGSVPLTPIIASSRRPSIPRVVGWG